MGAVPLKAVATLPARAFPMTDLPDRLSVDPDSPFHDADLLAKAEAFEKAYPSKLRAVVGSFFSSAKPTGRASGTAGS